ncbi:MAG: helix-turn-helix transcriptional regulator [Clostridia bacterium]|nr:helix-turn-helix transcriptional regulator [Clostridia bacterium]
MKIFSERLKELRQENNISLKALSKAIGVSDIAISRWENGLRTPNIEYLLAIAKFFGVSSDYLIGLED